MKLTKKQKKMLWRILTASALMLILQLIPATGWLRFALYMLPYLLVGYDVLRDAAWGIWHRQLFDENFLMAVATVGAIVLALWGSGDYTEAVAVLLFYQVGELFQGIAVGKSRKNIAALMDIRPDYANIEQNGQLQKVDPANVAVGTVITVLPGERIPMDGVIQQGCSDLDTAALTGESMPRSVAPGQEVYSGSINLTGVLHIQTTKPFAQSTVCRILELVENAAAKKSKSEAFISKFARVYTPAVCSAAAALALLPPLVLWAFGQPALFADWLYRALTFLVISCPCALIISIPLTFFAGIGGAGKAGILVKGSNYLETLAKVDTLVLDKTGTLTQGDFSVAGVHHNTLPAEQVIEYAALAECASPHPISRSLQRAYGQPIDCNRVTDTVEQSGRGVLAKVDGIAVAVGNEALLQALNIACIPCRHGGTVVHVAVDGVYAGHILITDQIKPGAKAALQAAKKAGIRQTVLLTGDNDTVAQQVAGELGIMQVHSRLLPADKVGILEQILHTAKGKVAFVGDGMNDAPVLSRADVGIAMGAIGSDAAIAAADVVFMDDDPAKLAKAIKIARKTMRIAYQNICLALGIKGLCLILGAFGVANMWLAIFADVGVMVLAVLNAMRALVTK